MNRLFSRDSRPISVMTVLITILFLFDQTSWSPASASDGGGSMYVTNEESGTVSVINTATNTVGKTIPVGVSPVDIAFDPTHARLYVTNAGSHTVSVINPATNTVVQTIPVGRFPVGIAFDSTHKRMYVAGAEQTLRFIDTNTNRVGPPIPVGVSGLGQIAFDPTHNRMYVINSGVPTRVWFIDTNTNRVGPPIVIGERATDIAFDPTHNRMYVTLLNGTVSVIATVTNSIGESITIEGRPVGITFDSTHDRMYVTVIRPPSLPLRPQIIGNVSVIETYSGLQMHSKIGVGLTPVGIAFDPTHNRMYVTNNDDHTVSIIDTNTDTVPRLPLSVGYDPYAITFVPP
jgi:YVTN family beta-propeller protein